MMGFSGKPIRKRTGNFESFDGTRIYFESRGEGTPVIFVYGIACLINHWHHQIEYFSQNHQVITFDLRGHNLSEIPKDLGAMTVNTMAKDIVALMDFLAIEKAHFVGHSFGVPVLIEFSSFAQDRALSFGFINGFARNPVQGMFGLDFVERFFVLGKSAHKNVPQLWNPLWKFAVRNPLSFLVTGAVGGFNLKFTEWKDIEIYARGVSQMSLDMFIPLFEDMMSFNGDDIIKSIQRPTLILAGAKDFVTPLSFQESMHQAISGSEYVVVQGGSHCTQLDFPEIVNAELTGNFKKGDSVGT